MPYPLPVMVESLLFVASEPVPVTQIAEALEVKLAEVEQALTELNAEIVARGVRVQRKGDKVQLTTQPECAPYVEKFLGLDLTTRLSKPALETLAIIAYQQPVTRAQIEHVRGVNCDAVLSTLLNRGLIEEVGRLETAGRPIQYGTTFAFLAALWPARPGRHAFFAAGRSRGVGSVGRTRTSDCGRSRGAV